MSDVQKIQSAGAVDPIAVVWSAAGDGTGHSVNQHWHDDNRARDLQLKQESCAKSFDVFIRSCSEHQPAAAAMFQKFWAHGMSLASGWQELCVQTQQELHHATTQHEQLQIEHEVLKANLMGLKATVQNMLGDVSALLHHANAPQPAVPDSCPVQSKPRANCQIRQQSAQQLQASGEEADVADCSDQDAAPAASSGTREQLLQEPQPSAAPSTNGSRRSSHIVSSLIGSIEKMSKQFADCQAGRLTPEAERFCCRASTISNSRSSSTHGNRIVRPAKSGNDAGSAGKGTVAPPDHAGSRLVSQLPVVVPQQLGAIRNKFTDHPATAVPAALAGARPSQSHPPSSRKVAASPTTAQRHTLAWFLQNAGSPLSVSSSMPSPAVLTSAAADAASSAGSRTAAPLDTTASTSNHRQKPDGKCAQSTAGKAAAAAAEHSADAAGKAVAEQPSAKAEYLSSEAKSLKGRSNMAQAASKSVLTAPPGPASNQQLYSREPSVSEWVAASSASTSTAQGQSGSNSRGSDRSLPSSSNHSRSSSRASLASQPSMTQGEGSIKGFAAVPEAAVSAPAMGARSASRGPSRGSLRTSGTSLTAMAHSRQQKRQQQESAGIYQFEPQSDAIGSGRATSNMVATAAAKLGLQLQQQQQQHLVQQRLCTSGSAGAAAPNRQVWRAAGNATAAAVAAEGPLTAGLHRQSSLARAPSVGIGSTWQSRPASTPADGQPGHSAVASGPAVAPLSAADTGAAVRQRARRAASAGAAAAGAANGTLRKPSSRPSIGNSQKQQQHAGVVAEEGPLQNVSHTRQAVPPAVMHSPIKGQGNLPTIHKQLHQDSPAKSGHSSSSEHSDMVLLGSCASTTGWSNHTSPACDTSAPKPPSPAAAAAAAGLADTGVGKILPSQDNSGISQANKVSASLPHKAHTANDLECSGTAAKNLNSITQPSQTNSAVEFDMSDSYKPDQRLVAAVALQDSQPSKTKPVGDHGSETATIALGTAVVPAAQLVMSLPGLLPETVTGSATGSVGPHNTSQVLVAEVTGPQSDERSVAQDSNQWDNDVQSQQDVNQYAAAPSTKSNQFSPQKPSMLEGLLAAENAINSTVQSSADIAATVATGAGGSTMVVMCAATADMVDPVDLPDAIKLPCRDDSPKKQLHKTPLSLAPAAAAAALTIARASSEGKRSLQQSSSYPSPAAAVNIRQVYPALRSISISRTSWEPQQGRNAEQVASHSCTINRGTPGSPLSPLSKRFRSSCDHLLEQLRNQHLLRDGRHGDQHMQQLHQQTAHKEQQQDSGQDAQQPLQSVIVNQAGAGDRQVTVPQLVQGISGYTGLVEEARPSEPAASADTVVIECSFSQQQHQHEVPLIGCPTAPDPVNGSSPAASEATALDDSIVTVWQATVLDAVAASKHSCVVIDLTGSSEEPAVETAAVHSDGMLAAEAAVVLTSSEAVNHNCAQDKAEIHSGSEPLGLSSIPAGAAADSEIEVGASQDACNNRSVPKLASFPVAVSMESLVSAASCESLSAAQTRTAAGGANDRVGGGPSRLAVASGPHLAAATDGQSEILLADDVTDTAAHGNYADSPVAADRDHADYAAVGHDHCGVHASAACESTTARDAALPAAIPTAGSADSADHELPESFDVLKPHSCPRSSAAAVVVEDVPEFFSLQELLPIVLDVMAAKTAIDEECDARHLPRLAPARQLQRYVRVQVPDDSGQYSQALAMLLASLDQHKDQQPEVAVFCRILGGEVDEDYFQHHLALRSHLQLLAAHALLQHTGNRLHQHQQLQQPPSYDVCYSVAVNDAQLSWLLGAWGRQRSSVVARTMSSHDGQPEEQLHSDWWTAVNSHCMEGLGLRLTAGVVDALLLWELEQQVSRLAAVAGAFKAADTASTGLLDLQQFHIFCHELNDAMPDSEVTTLFINELDRQRVGLVSFNELCRCLLSAM